MKVLYSLRYTRQVQCWTKELTHGKNRIAQHGDTWAVLPLPNRVPEFPAGSMLVQSVKTGDTRWLTDDFKVIEND